MRKTILRMLGFVVLALAASHSVSAQTMLKAKIPFPFRASGAYLSSGDYTVGAVPGNGPTIFLIRNDSTRQGVFLTRRYQLTSRQAGDPRLVFNCVDGACTLSQLWMASDGGVQLTVPRTPANSERLIATQNVPLKP